MAGITILTDKTTKELVQLINGTPDITDAIRLQFDVTVYESYSLAVEGMKANSIDWQTGYELLFIKK